jgi:hypothetical protein
MVKKTFGIFFFTTTLFFLISCNSNSVTKVDEPKIQINENINNAIIENQFLDSNLKLAGKFDEEHNSCYHYRYWLHVLPLTKNKDSLLKAARILVDRVSLSVKYEPDCRRKKVILLFLFESPERYKKGEWMMSAKLDGPISSSDWGHFY